MSNLVFTPSQSPATLAAVIAKLLAQWSLLPASLQTELDARRQAFGNELLALKEIQRAAKISEFLQWLETNRTAATLASAEFAAGKGPAMRSGFALVSNEQVAQLKAALEAPVVQPTTAKPTVQLEFQIDLHFVPSLSAGAQQPLIVQLTPDTRPPAQRGDGLVVTFENLQTPVPLEVSLSAPGFQEQTGHWTRTIYVFGTTPSLPAVFLLEAGQTTGAQPLAVNFYQPVGRTWHQVEITVQSKDISRNAESMISKGPLSQSSELYTKLDFPGQVRPRAVQPLLVQLTVAPPKASRVASKFDFAFADRRKPEFIEVVVTAPGFQERTASWRRVLAVYANTDSQPAVFLLEAGQTVGAQLITVDFYHRGRIVNSAAFTSEITTQPNTAPLVMAREPRPIGPWPSQSQPPADLELRIVLNRQTNELSFTLHAENAELGYQRRAMGQVTLSQNPRQFLQSTFQRLSKYARRPGTSAPPASPTSEPNRPLQLRPSEPSENRPVAKLPAEIAAEIETIGQDLFGKVFSPELQAEYWRLKTLREQGKINSLLILSDEPWIPWEMVKPYAFDRTTQQAYNDDYLGLAFQVTRWLAGPGLVDRVAVQTARIVLPNVNLPATAREQEFFADLEKRGVAVGAPLRTRSEVLQTTRAGDIKLFHLATHGAFTPANAGESPIALQGGEMLIPDDLAGAQAEGFRRARPIVFFNACHSSQGEFTLTGLGGWAERMVGDIGVSAFVGSLWEVNDALAAAFAIEFYQNIGKGQRLGAAFRQARLAIRQGQPDNPTWLAYTLYADPNAQVTLGQ